MQDIEVAGLLREAMLVALKLAGPPLVVALVTGTVMSLLQAVTQINEQTLAFLPKVAAIFGTLLALGTFMNTTLVDFSRLIMDRIVSLGAG
jgi:flagellar biosynthetic protein FliQ